MTDLVGQEATVTLAIGADGTPGEVTTADAIGGSQTLIAYSDEPIARGTTVVIYQDRGSRRVDVSPLKPKGDISVRIQGPST